MRRVWFVCVLVLAVFGCTAKPGPGGPCSVGGLGPAAVSFPGPDAWDLREIPQPPGAWIGNLALSPDGTQAIYANAIPGATIPHGEGVSLVRIDLGAEANHTLLELPGEALRNQANLDWSAPGLAWSSWSSLGTANVKAGKAWRLYSIPKTGEKRTTFPLFTSVAWGPAGDCVAGTVEREDRTGELIAWKAAGALDASHRFPIESLETIAAWNGEYMTLLSMGTAGTPHAREVDLTGKPREQLSATMAQPPQGSEAIARLGNGWLAISKDGSVTYDGNVVAKIPYALNPKDRPGAPGVVAVKASEQIHRFERIIAADSGRAIAVEEGISGQGLQFRHMHVLTPKRP